jgi:hypothetical protein
LMTPDGEHQKHQERGEGVELHFHAQWPGVQKWTVGKNLKYSISKFHGALFSYPF